MGPGPPEAIQKKSIQADNPANLTAVAEGSLSCLKVLEFVNTETLSERYAN